MSVFTAIELIYGSLPYIFALATEFVVGAISSSLFWCFCLQSLNDGFNQRDGLSKTFNVAIIIVPFFFNSMKSFLKHGLLVSHETSFFRIPSWMRCPFIIKDGFA